jgi:hypothetical protein
VKTRSARTDRVSRSDGTMTRETPPPRAPDDWPEKLVRVGAGVFALILAAHTAFFQHIDYAAGDPRGTAGYKFVTAAICAAIGVAFLLSARYRGLRGRGGRR